VDVLGEVLLDGDLKRRQQELIGHEQQLDLRSFLD
jgi:hypothetical protein